MESCFLPHTLQTHGGRIMEGRDKGSEPAVFVEGEKRVSKTGGNSYVWFKTIDLEQVIRELGTQYVNVRMVVPKKQDDSQSRRLLIFNPSSRRFVDSTRPSKKPEKVDNTPREDDDILI